MRLFANTANNGHNHADRKRLRTRTTAITIRRARPGEETAIARPATLDSAPNPAQPVLVAAQDGQLRGARSMLDGATLIDPFVPDGVRALLASAADPSRAFASVTHGSTT
jgi:hypothetical protein